MTANGARGALLAGHFGQRDNGSQQQSSTLLELGVPVSAKWDYEPDAGLKGIHAQLASRCD